MNNVFSFSLNNQKTLLAFTDTNATLSGILMKAINFRYPRVIEKLKEKAKNSELKVGDYVQIYDYLFVILKKNYRNKINAAAADTIFKQLPIEVKEQKIKTTLEDYPELKEVIAENFPLTEFYETSKWKFD